jgi:hypothetical protein
MATDTQKRVYDLLQQMPRQGLPAAKQLFWTELNYDRANRPVSRRRWPGPARQALNGAPLLLAQHESDLGGFQVVCASLAPEQRGHDIPFAVHTVATLAPPYVLRDLLLLHNAAQDRPPAIDRRLGCRFSAVKH